MSESFTVYLPLATATLDERREIAAALDRYLKEERLGHVTGQGTWLGDAFDIGISMADDSQCSPDLLRRLLQNLEAPRSAYIVDDSGRQFPAYDPPESLDRQLGLF